ncbi:MAG: PilZ domain-containing protein [Deltaproteobacteria bacterium]|nr:PilZ domain-containing protein [Deltaproteobacteria bacterium]
MAAEREHPRYAHEAVVTFHAVGKTHWGRTQNLSRGGLCADIAEPIANGADIEVDIQLVFDEVESEPLRLPARVAWCTTLDDSFQIGLSFQKLTAEQQQYLSLFLKYLDDGAPKQRTKRESNLDKRFG